MLSFIVSGLRQRFGNLLVASLVPLVAFGGLIAVDQLLPSAAESDSRTGFRWLMLVLALLLPACHGFLWSVSTAFLADQTDRKSLGWRLSLPLSFVSIRSLWVTMGWTLLVVFIFIGAGMLLIGLLAYRDPGELVASTVQQAQEYGDGTRIAPERGAGGQSVRSEDFNQPLLLIFTSLCALGALWIWLKSLMCVPLRLLRQPINLLTALDSTAGWRGVRLTLWVSLVGGTAVGTHWALALVVPMAVLMAYDAVLFVLVFWIVGGMLAWHAQKYVASQG